MADYRTRRRITFPARPVTAKISRRDVVRYLLGDGWIETPSRRWFLNADTGQRVPSPRRDDRALSDVIEAIARRERRCPAETLRDIDDARWLRRSRRHRRAEKVWPVL